MNPEKRAILPSLAFRGFLGKFQPPNVKEGFQDVVTWDFSVSDAVAISNLLWREQSLILLASILTTLITVHRYRIRESHLESSLDMRRLGNVSLPHKSSRNPHSYDTLSEFVCRSIYPIPILTMRLCSITFQRHSCRNEYRISQAVVCQSDQVRCDQEMQTWCLTAKYWMSCSMTAEPFTQRPLSCAAFLVA